MAGAGFTHPALYYRDLDEYLAGVGGFVRDAVAADKPVLVAVPGDHLEALREYAPSDAATFVDMSVAGRNPGRILTMLTDFARAAGDAEAHIVGEPIWPGRTEAEMREATRHEALINLAFAGITATILCPYDVSGLPPPVVADAERTHPVIWEKGRSRRSEDYVDPHVIDAECQAPVTDDADRVLPLTTATLTTVRHEVESFAVRAGLSGDRLYDFVLVADEAASNGIRHGGAGGGRAGQVLLWQRPDAVVLEVRDHGALPDPLVGRRRPDPAVPGGRGVWLMHQLCDLVEFRTGAVRLTVALYQGASHSPS